VGRLIGRPLVPDGRGPLTDLDLALLRAIESLTPRQRDVLVLRSRGGLSHAEVAARLRISPSAARAYHRDAIDAMARVVPGLLAEQRRNGRIG